MSSLPRELAELARRCEVDLGYHDIDGAWHEARAEALVAVLAACGAPVERAGDAGEALRALDHREIAEPLEPVGVAWCERGGGLAARLSAADLERAEISAQLALEDGSTRDLVLPVAPGQGAPLATRDATRHRVRLALPDDLPPGRHGLDVRIDGRERRALVIAAPFRAPSPTARSWGVFAPLFGLRKADGAGVGDYGVLARLVSWVARLGGSFVGSTPLLAMFVGRPCVPSPYAPISRLFWNELMIDPTRTPEWEASAPARALWNSSEARAARTRLVEADTLDWRAVREQLEPVLRELARAAFAADSPRRAALLSRARAWPELETFARFRAALDRHGTDWRSWPEAERGGALPDEVHDDRVRRHLWAQLAADEQLAATSTTTRDGEAAGPYLDLPVGSHPGGFDCWRWPELFAAGAAIGAPPDTLFAGGQNWDFRPPIPHASRAEGHAHFAACLRHHLRHARLLRIDHVMALHRLYWIPEGMRPTEGIYVRYPADELYATVCLEAFRAGVPVAGEDLGTVPDEVREAMSAHGLLRSFVGQFAFRTDEGAPWGEPPAQAVASLNTHDTPTFAGFWSEVDLDAFEEIGCLPPERLAAMRGQRQRLRERLPALLAEKGLLDEASGSKPVDLLRALHRALATSDAALVQVNLEDLWLEPRPQNVPGTGFDRPNFRRALARLLDEIERDPDLARELAQIDRWRRSRG